MQPTPKCPAYNGFIMSKKEFFTSLVGIVLLLIGLVGQSPVRAQSGKPSKALRQLQEEQLKAQQEFDRDVANGKAQTYEWEIRADAMRKRAADRAAEFKIANWKGLELLALIILYREAELHALAVEASRRFLQTEPRSRFTDTVRGGLIRALLELEQLEEAQKWLDELYREPPQNQLVVADRVELVRLLTIAWRERGRYDLVSKYARRGYDLKVAKSRFSFLQERDLSDVLTRNRLVLAAEYIAAQERSGFKAEASEFHKKVLATEFDEQEVLKAYYEAELAAARLMFNPAPELDAPRWMDSEPVKLAGLRGKVVLMDFWAMWCTECTTAFPKWRELQQKFSGKGLEIIGVTKLYGRSDTEEGLKRDQELDALRNFKTRYQLKYPFAIGRMDDVTNDERYGIGSLPTVILIDRRGNVRHVKRGVGEYRKLERQIEKLLNER